MQPGEIVGLIGPNGAGKTTAFNVISGLYRPDSGEIDFDGRSIVRAAPHRIARRGLARRFQNLQLFRTMTMEENVLVGTDGRFGWGRTRRARSRVREVLDTWGSGRTPREVAAFRTARRSGSSSPARSRRGRACCCWTSRPVASTTRRCRPCPPSTGMRRDLELTVLLVEHHESRHDCLRPPYVRLRPRIAAGTPQEVQAESAVIEAYLGEADLMALLELEDVEARYVPRARAQRVTLTVSDGELVAVPGATEPARPRRCGNLGTVRRRGTIRFAGRAIARSPEGVARAGIAHVPEGAAPSRS